MTGKTQRRIAFGYNRGPVNQIEINEAQALTVKLLYEYYAEGLSLRAIAEKLESHGIPSPYNNLKWGTQAIVNILSYERYMGDIDYPAIIDRDLFERVQVTRQSRSK
jgi:site-specific DNA recombinase